MVFKHNSLPFDHNGSFELDFQHTGQLDCGGQFALSAYRNVPDGVTSNYVWALDNTSNVSWDMGRSGDTISLENSKRPFDDDENLKVVAKRTKQMDDNMPPSGGTCKGSFTSVTADDEFNNSEGASVHERATDIHVNNFSFPWLTRSPSSDETLLSCFPGYYEDHHQPIVYNQIEETQSPIFDHLPRKLVSVGPNHQAELPLLRPKSFRNSYDEGSSSDKWMGLCIMPMPDSNSLEDEIGRCEKTACQCLDEGSVRCVRRHVTEAREELKVSLGNERFIELGFREMGEDVALNWTEEEEQIFHEVVRSNPASLGKNFWDQLPRIFDKSMKELVSYYFNVFMLRKRAEQNRFDPSSADSDNDEWQYNEDDSGVESPEEYRAVSDVHQNSHGSCTSYEAEHDRLDCDLKIWDGFEKGFDFLPTCNVIEEVFGCESWEKSREGQGVS